jgi:uncharacterized membrane protein
VTENRNPTNVREFIWEKTAFLTYEVLTTRFTLAECQHFFTQPIPAPRGILGTVHLIVEQEMISENQIGISINIYPGKGENIIPWGSIVYVVTERPNYKCTIEYESYLHYLIVFIPMILMMAPISICFGVTIVSNFRAMGPYFDLIILFMGIFILVSILPFLVTPKVLSVRKQITDYIKHGLKAQPTQTNQALRL